jgi:hypothetical protein
VVIEQVFCGKMKKRAKTSSKPKLTMKRQTAKSFEFYCTSGKLIWGRASSCLPSAKVEEPFSDQKAAKGKWGVEEISVQRDESGPTAIGYLIRWAELDAALILAQVSCDCVLSVFFLLSFPPPHFLARFSGFCGSRRGRREPKEGGDA